MEDIYRCECSSSEHFFTITIDEDDPNDKFVYVLVHLKHKPVLHRIWTAIKYIFGYKSRFGSFEEIIIKKEDKQRLLETFNKL